MANWKNFISFLLSNTKLPRVSVHGNRLGQLVLAVKRLTGTMANLDFYAVRDDLRDLIEFVFSEDVIIYESYSEFDCEARLFRSLSDIEAVFQLGAYQAAHLQLWSPAVMTQPVISRITLKGVPGHKFRHSVEGAGLMQLYLDGIRDGVVYHTHFGHWNEAGARQRSVHPADDCNWPALRKLSGRIERYIRGRLSAAKLYSRPVLHHCFAAVQQGVGLSFGPDIHRADSKNIVTTAPVGDSTRKSS